MKENLLLLMSLLLGITIGAFDLAPMWLHATSLPMIILSLLVTIVRYKIDFKHLDYTKIQEIETNNEDGKLLFNFAEYPSKASLQIFIYWLSAPAISMSNL